MSAHLQDSRESTSFQLGLNALPQYGFGPHLTFDALVRHNPFLFRVYAPKPLPPFFDSSQPFFIGPKFKKSFDGSDEEMEPPFDRPLATYADIINHMDAGKKSTSPYVTTSFSFAWAIWEATRRYNANPNYDIEVAIIDARALADRAVTALEVLRQGSQNERHPDHWKWYQSATQAQDALIYGYIPGSAVLASIPILSLLPKLPSYFLSSDPSADEKHFNSLTWDVSAPRANFQQFCQQMSEQFLRSPTEVRLRDTTAGAVHLAMGFLRPWFQKHAPKDFHGAIHLVAELAYIVARWPGSWWVRERPEIWDLIQAMVHVIGEEVRDAQRVHALGEVMRLEGVVSELQLLTEEYVYVHSRPGSVTSGSRSRSSSIGETDIRTSIVMDTVAVPACDHSVQTSPVTHETYELSSSAPTNVEAVSCMLSSFFFGVFAALVFASGRQVEFVSFT